MKVCAIVQARVSSSRFPRKVLAPLRGKPMVEYLLRSLAKSKGGVGEKITGCNNRTFKANVQVVRAVVKGRLVQLHVAAKYISRGMVTKPVKRQWTKELAAAEAFGAARPRGYNTSLLP